MHPRNCGYCEPCAIGDFSSCITFSSARVASEKALAIAWQEGYLSGRKDLDAFDHAFEQQRDMDPILRKFPVPTPNPYSK